MWVLSHIKTGRRLYLLTDSKKYTVGRMQTCDLILDCDSSVSREHAVIHRSSSGIRVEDLSSKYGTFINNDIDTNKAIEAKTPVNLTVGNIVRFGRLENVFRLENIEFKISTSTMSAANMESLKKQLKLIDGVLQNAWTTDCTHLVMTNVTVTVKVLQSLAYGVPIVSPSFIDAVINCAREKQLELPNVINFVPDITEPYIIKEPRMMEVHLDRQRLFQNKTFVFMVRKHMERFEPIVKLAAGKCASMEDGNVSKRMLLKTDYVPVQYSPSAHTQCYFDVDGIVQHIESHGRRLIGEAEIGLAIIHRNTDRFCNPDRQMMKDFEAASVNTDEVIKKVLLEETPLVSNTEKPIVVPESIIIPESINLSTEPNNNLRNREDVDLDKASTSPARRSTRVSLKSTAFGGTKPSASEAIIKVPTPKKATGTPQKNQKRKADPQENAAQDALPGQSMPEKKQKTADESKGESSSAHFVEPIPPSSENDLNFSGFISTQNRFNRKRKNAIEAASQSTQPTKVAHATEVTRKRALSMLNDDSDDDKNENNDVFNFNRRSKRSKLSSKESHRGASERNTLNDNADDDDDGFNFSRKTQSRQKSSKSKSTQNKAAEQSEVDGPVIAESQNSYKKPFQHALNRTYQRIAVPAIDITSTTICETDWITRKLKKELNLNEQEMRSTPSSGAVKIKEEKLEEWEMTDTEKKRNWIKSFEKVFQVRKIEVNQSRHSAIDETDAFANTGDTSLNRTKNFKKFVKKNNYIPHTIVIKTNPVPVTISAFARI